MEQQRSPSARNNLMSSYMNMDVTLKTFGRIWVARIGVGRTS
jgi:hypothetical protein